MKAKKDEKQIRALECLDELTAYASKNKLPMRIMDELEDCKKQISSENADWAAINLRIEDILNSIEHKMTPQTVQEKHIDNEVSIEMIKEQVDKMAKRCRADNTTSVAGMSERKNTIIKKNCEQLMEISHTKAHMEELKNEELYLQFFQNCKTKYERDSFDMFRELLQSLSDNYNHMMNHMKSMFQSIGGYQSGIGNEKFYYEYEEQRTGIDQRVQGEMQTEDIGGDDIISFGQTTKETVKNIVKKLVRKRKILAWVPVLVLLCFLAMGAVSLHVSNQNDTKQVEADAAADTKEEDSFLEDVAKEIGKKALREVSMKSLMKGLSSALATLGAVLILIVMVIALLYVCYIKILKKWCNHQISRQCGEYLKTELLRFEQTNEFSSKLDTAMENAADEYERQYMNVWNNLFCNSRYYAENTTQTGNASEFDSLRAECHRVYNM